MQENNADDADKAGRIVYNKLYMARKRAPPEGQLSLPFDEAANARKHWEAISVIIRFCDDINIVIGTMEDEGFMTRNELVAEYNQTCFIADSGEGGTAIKTFETFIDDKRKGWADTVDHLIAGRVRTPKEAIELQRRQYATRMRSVTHSYRQLLEKKEKI